MPQSRPTILQIVPRLDTGGAERSVVEIAVAVVRAGGLALVLTEPGRLAPEVVAAGGEIIEFRPPRRTRCGCWPMLMRSSVLSDSGVSTWFMPGAARRRGAR